MYINIDLLTEYKRFKLEIMRLDLNHKSYPNYTRGMFLIIKLMQLK